MLSEIKNNSTYNWSTVESTVKYVVRRGVNENSFMPILSHDTKLNSRGDPYITA
jgi:hypothetical protein